MPERGGVEEDEERRRRRLHGKRKRTGIKKNKKKSLENACVANLQGYNLTERALEKTLYNIHKQRRGTVQKRCAREGDATELQELIYNLEKITYKGKWVNKKRELLQ